MDKTIFEKKRYTIAGMVRILCRCIPLYVLGILALTAVEALLPAAQTLSVARFVDVAAGYLAKGHGTGTGLLYAIAAIILCQLAVILCPAVRAMLERVAKQRLQVRLQTELVHKRASLAYWQVEDQDSWDLVTRVTEDPTGRIMQVLYNVISLGRLVITILSILAIILRASVGAGLAIIAVSVPFCWVAMRAGESNYRMAREQKKVQRRYRYLADILTQRETVEERNLFGFTAAVGREYKALFHRSYKIEKGLQVRQFANLKSGSVITLVLAVVIIAMLCPSLLDGRLSLGLFIALTTAILNLVQSMSWQLSDIMFALAESKAYCRDFTAFMAMEDAEGAWETPVGRPDCRVHTIRFEDVGFAYPGTERPILSHCSFLLEQGHNYAFVGENGAGKTTIVKLLLGLYDNYTGRILVDGRDLRSIPYGERKGLFSAVSQDFARYELTIGEYVRLGEVNAADEARVEAVLKRCQLWDLVESLPDGVNTKLGRLDPAGRDLSGGQWQRLAIARLLYGRAPVNILDEPTAALDPRQESAVYEMFRRVSEDLFTIFITHRLGAARVADEILVVKDGGIAERGSHEALMQLEDGTYRAMYEAQRSWYE